MTRVNPNLCNSVATVLFPARKRDQGAKKTKRKRGHILEGRRGCGPFVSLVALSQALDFIFNAYGKCWLLQDGKSQDAQVPVLQIIFEGSFFLSFPHSSPNLSSCSPPRAAICSKMMEVTTRAIDSEMAPNAKPSRSLRHYRKPRWRT